MSASSSVTLRGAAQLPVRQLGEPAFHQVDPRCAGGREVQLEPEVAQQSLLRFRGLVRGVVAADQVQVQVLGDGVVDQLEEP